MGGLFLFIRVESVRKDEGINDSWLLRNEEIRYSYAVPIVAKGRTEREADISGSTLVPDGSCPFSTPSGRVESV